MRGDRGRISGVCERVQGVQLGNTSLLMSDLDHTRHVIERGRAAAVGTTTRRDGRAVAQLAIAR